MNAPLPFLNREVERLPVYQPGRPIDELARQLGVPRDSIIKLASNENPLGPSPAALRAIQASLPRLHLYPDGNAFYLKRKLAEKLGVEPENLILGNGSNEVLELAAHACLGPGKAAVVSQYCFAVYPIVTRLLGSELITVPARNLGHDLPAMLRALTPQTRVLFIANPNNPTGSLASRAEVTQVINETPESTLAVFDEAYIEYLDDPIDLLPLVRRGLKPNLFLTRTFSKIFGLAGIRLGYGIGHPEFIRALERVREPFNVNSLAQEAAVAALDDADHVARTRANNRAGLRYFESLFRQLRRRWAPSAGNFVLAHAGDGQAVCEALQAVGIITRPMGGYQLPEWLRISVGQPEENRRCGEALRRIFGAGAEVGR